MTMYKTKYDRDGKPVKSWKLLPNGKLKLLKKQRRLNYE